MKKIVILIISIFLIAFLFILGLSKLSATPNESSYLVFVSSGDFNGSRGGIFGFEDLCQNLAIKAMIHNSTGDNYTERYFNAWVSSSFLNASSIIYNSNVSYLRVDGTQIAANWTDLIDGNLRAPINIDEYGNDVGSVAVWTATKTDGSSEHQIRLACKDWKTDSKVQFAMVGLAQHNDSRWTEYTNMDWCKLSRRVYCIQQPSEFFVNRSRVFVTSNRYDGSQIGGLSGADAICQALAVDAGLGNKTWVAGLSNTSTSLIDRLNQTNFSYSLVDRKTVISDNRSDLFDSVINNKINMNEKGQILADTTLKVWTHTYPNGTTYGINVANNLYACNNWLVNDNNNRSVVGDAQYTNASWIDLERSRCSNSQRFFCFEING